MESEDHTAVILGVSFENNFLDTTKDHGNTAG